MRAIVVLIVLLALWQLWRTLNRQLYGDWFSPFNLLFYFWCAPYLLSLAQLSALQGPVSGRATICIITSTIILATTCMLPAAFRQKFVSLNGPLVVTYRAKPVWVMAFFTIVTVALYFAEFRGRDLPLFAYLLGDAGEATLHTSGKDSRLQVLAFGTHVAGLFVVYLWLNERRLVARTIYLLLSVTLVLVGFLKASKSDVFIPLLTYGALLYYHYKARGSRIPRGFKMLGLLIGLVLVSITSVRLLGVGVTEGYADLIEFKYAEQLGRVPSEIVSIAYGYGALGFENFSRYVETHIVEYRLGTSLFRPALSAVLMGDIADKMTVPVDQWNVVIDAANTGTFLTPLYVEGGMLWCLIGSFAYGIMVNVMYSMFRMRGSPTWLFIYLTFLFPWTWLFFTNAFSVLSIYVNAVYAALLARVAVSRGPSRAWFRHELRVAN